MKDSEIKTSLYARFLDFKPRKGDLRKIALLEAAIECLHTVGVEKITLEALGKHAGMTKAHVAYYYPNRDAVIEAAIKFVVAVVQGYTVDAVKQATKDRLDAFVDATFRWFADHPAHRSVILLLYYYASFDSKFLELHTEIRNLGAERLEAILKSEYPRLKPRAAAELAKEIQALLTGHLLAFTTTHSKSSLAQLQADLMRRIESNINLFQITK